jgi:hypothetical protein
VESSAEFVCFKKARQRGSDGPDEHIAAGLITELVICLAHPVEVDYQQTEGRSVIEAALEFFVERTSVGEAGEVIAQRKFVKPTQLLLHDRSLMHRGHGDSDLVPVEVEANTGLKGRSVATEPMDAGRTVCRLIGANQERVHDDVVLSAPCSKRTQDRVEPGMRRKQ